MTWLSSLYEIVTDCTTPYRKGEPIEAEDRGGIHVLRIYGYKPTPEDSVATEQIVDVHYFRVGVDVAKARQHAGGLAEALTGYPDLDRLAQGPSYIEVGGELGDQETALRLFALGQTLGMWDVITPARLGIDGEDADQLAGVGLVLCSGWPPK